MKTGVIIRLNERRSCMLAPHSSMSTACAGPRDARQDFQVSLAHSVRAGATIPGLAPLARASAARRSSGARFRRAPDARPPWLYGAMAWLLRPPGRAYLVLLAIGASHLPWLAAGVVQCREQVEEWNPLLPCGHQRHERQILALADGMPALQDIGMQFLELARQL